MKNIYKLSFLIVMCFTMLSAGSAVFAYQNPTANAGTDLYLNSGQTAVLQGSGYDPNGYPSNYNWTCNGGTLSSYNIAQPVYTAPYVNNNNPTTYTCTLTATNSYGNSNSDSMVVYINYNNSYYVQTTYATYISDFEATLNGSLTNANSYTTNYAYFQWGTTTDYGSETPRQAISYARTFMQNIANLNSGTTYHYRAVVQSNYGTVYGQDMTFKTSGSNGSPTVANIINNPQVYGASTVSTGLTNNFLTDSFFLPILIIILLAWLYFTGRVYDFADWLK